MNEHNNILLTSRFGTLFIKVICVLVLSVSLYVVVYLLALSSPTKFQADKNIIIFVVCVVPVIAIFFYFIFSVLTKTKHVSLSNKGLVFNNTYVEWQSIEWLKVNYGGNGPHFTFKFKNHAASKKIIGVLPLFNSKNAELLLESANRNNVLIHKI